MNNSFNKQKAAEELKKVTGGKIDSDSISAAANGKPQELLGKLSAQDRAKIMQTLNNKELLQQLLASDDAKKIINKLSGNNNG